MKNFILTIVALITFYFPASAQKESSEIIAQKIEALLSEYPIDNGPGISITVVKEGEMIFQKHNGFANLEHMVPIADSTKFVVGSISKQFTVFAILLLEEAGKLSIDDDIANYLGETSELEHKVTIRQLMNHTSGFRNTSDLYNLKGKSEEDLVTQKEIVDLLLRQKGLNFIPGTKFQYCNSGYVLLAEIVERVSGMTFAQFTQEKIFKPLKMNNSLFLDDLSLVVKNKAHSYSEQENEYQLISLNRSIVGSTGLNTTTYDLSLWAMNFDDPIIGNNRIFDKMKEQGVLNSGEIIPYALGQELKKYKGLDVIFHGGGDAGFRSYLLRVPEHRFAVIVSGNFESFNPLNISYGLLDVFLSDYIEEPKEKEIPEYTNKDLRRFEGDYQVFPGLYISIFTDQDSLYFKSYGSSGKVKLPVIGENEFEFPDRQHSKFRFVENGLVWHFSDFYYRGKKVDLNPPTYASIDLAEYEGIYKSAEVETSYEFVIKDNEIFITHNFNPDVKLRPIGKDAFVTDQGYIGRIVFLRNAKGEIISCEISGQASYDVSFLKTE